MGGSVALVQEDGLIVIDIPRRQLDIVGAVHEAKSPDHIEVLLAEQAVVKTTERPKAHGVSLGAIRSEWCWRCRGRNWMRSCSCRQEAGSMRVTAVNTHLVYASWRNWVIVQVETDGGLTGLGEATLEGKGRTIAAAVEELARYLVGKDPGRIEEHVYRMYRDAFWRGGPVLNSAISGVEQALWDIKGKALGVPVYELLGGPCRNRIKMYVGGWFGGAHTPEDFAARARWAVNQGFRALKWDPFGHSDLFINQEASRRAVECVRAVREAVGPEVELFIEAHGRLSPANAIRLARQLEPYDIGFYEEPVPPENIAAMEKVARSVHIPIATGERLFTVFGFRELLERQVADVIQPDPCHAGGISAVKKIAGMAEAYYVAVAPHNPNSPVATAVCLHLAAAIPNFLILEMTLDLDVPWRRDLLTEPIEIKGGFIELPRRPGLGVELNLDVVRAHPYRPVDIPVYEQDESRLTSRKSR